MKKFLVAFVAMTVIFTACKKEIPETPVAGTVELEFVIDQTNFGGLKSTDIDVPECQDLAWSYVTFKIFDGTTTTEYTSEVIHMPNGDQLTQVVKLPSAETYTLTEFLVWNDVLPIGPDPLVDILIRAAPADGSEYWDLMVNKLDLPVVVEDFKKKQIIIDVLCFEDLYYENFGFFWFEMNDVKIERQCFFGDICVDDLTPYAGSLYAQQSQGLQMDMPAIMKIEVYKSVGEVPPVWGSPIKTFTNDEWATPGEGACMEVYWANDLDLTEDFKFELYIWLPDGSGIFDWVPVDTPWEFQDEDCPEAGNDGVVDYVLGTCQIDEVDFILSWPSFNTVTDIDGNTYNTIEIGTQTWIAENLKVTHYPNGDAIPHITSNTDWGNLAKDNVSDAYCYYDNDPNNGTIYGALYTYAAAIGDNWERDNAENQGICPNGWHLPNNTEWTTLYNYLGGMGGSTGSKLSGNALLWTDGALDSHADFGTSEFSLLPSGQRYNSSSSDGIFVAKGITCELWSSTVAPWPDQSGKIELHYTYPGIYRHNIHPKSSGIAVRCVKD